MADTELAPEEGLEPEVVSEEDAQVEVHTDTNPIEALASEIGWRPKEEYRGNPDDWKPADEFIRASKDIQGKLSRDIRDLKSTVTNMSRTSATLLEQQLAERDAYWAGKKREAVEAGDYEAVEHADEQRQNIRAQIKPETAAPEGQDFARKHASWFNVDADATRYAISRADFYAKQGLPPVRQLAAVEQDMKGVFPDLFPAPAKQAPAVSRPGSRSAGASSRAKGLHDLPAEAQAVARDMHDRLGIPIETYVQNWFNQPERKV